MFNPRKSPIDPVPPDTLKCWYIDDRIKKEAIKSQKPFSEHQTTSQYFKIVQRLDNTFIEGFMGSIDHEFIFFDQINTVYTFFNDYENRKKIYFSFDRISLYQVMEIITENPLRFILKRIDSLKPFRLNQAFMIMPFHNSDLDKFYLENVKSFLNEELKIQVYRVDDFRDNDIIIEKIYDLIEESEFVIADTTLENKNVFYEIGYASALGREMITIQNRTVEQKLFFDRAHIRSIFYDVNNISAFHFDLKSTIQSIRSRQ